MSRWVKLMLCLVLLGCAHDPRAGLAFMNEGPARRVAIEPFVGGGEIEGLALPLREAVAAELLRRTNHTVTNRPTADTLLRGEIRSASRRLLGRSTESGLPSALRLEITLDMEWVDLASGAVLKSLRNVRIAADYAPGGAGVAPGGERETVARQQLFRRTARTVVDALQSEW
ncbi:MAG: LPS assembly lipoprotein LptE [Planctomycetota bacterium]|nr:LPS assembly lipoprotein LptE [Planctomycetota bacterium]